MYMMALEEDACWAVRRVEPRVRIVVGCWAVVVVVVGWVKEAVVLPSRMRASEAAKRV